MYGHIFSAIPIAQAILRLVRDDGQTAYHRDPRVLPTFLDYIAKLRSGSLCQQIKTKFFESVLRIPTIDLNTIFSEHCSHVYSFIRDDVKLAQLVRAQDCRSSRGRRFDSGKNSTNRELEYTWI